MSTTIPNVIKHSDLPMEAITYIDKNIKVVNKTEAFWDKFVNHDKTPKCDTIKYRKQVLVDPVAIAKLEEGIIPDPTKIRVVEFKDSLLNVGSYLKYTRENLNNLDDLSEMAANQLAHERLYDLENIKFAAFKGTTCTFTKTTGTWQAKLLALKTQMMKNKAKPAADGTFLFIAPGEIMNQILTEAGEKMKGSEEGAKILGNGYIGKYCGFSFVERDDGEMYHDTGESTSLKHNAYVFVIGKTENGEFPVKARDFAGENAEVINNGISSSDKNDPLNQFGTIGSRIDGVGAKLIAPECVLKAEIDITTDFVAGNDLYGADLKEIKVEVSSAGATSTTEDKPTAASKTDSGKVPTK